MHSISRGWAFLTSLLDGCDLYLDFVPRGSRLYSLFLAVKFLLRKSGCSITFFFFFFNIDLFGREHTGASRGRGRG